MRVHVAALAFDPLGSIELNVLSDSSDFGENRRRTNRVATLDGGAVFNDFGFTYSDRTIRLVWIIESMQQSASIQRLLRLNSFLRVSIPDGVFICAPESFSSTQQQGTLTLLVKSKED
jgi:hypothetical protein